MIRPNMGPEGTLVRKSRVTPEAYSDVHVTIVAYPYRDRVGELTLRNFLRLFPPGLAAVHVVTGKAKKKGLNGMHVEQVPFVEPKGGLTMRLCQYLLSQIRLAAMVHRLAPASSAFLFHIGMTANPLPLLVARMRRKPTVLVFTGALDKTIRQLMTLEGGTLAALTSWMSPLVQAISLSIASKVAVQSESVTKFANLERWRHKIVIFGAIPVDTDEFRVIRPVTERQDAIGYVGRLSPEKGVREFVDALPVILDGLPGARIVIAGEGPLEPYVQSSLNGRDRVQYLGWVNHRTLPELLNELKILVLPSKTEGLPAIAEEAMACGTIVLASPVGGIPDIIADGVSGFLLPSTEPGSMLDSISSVLHRKNLGDVSDNGRKIIVSRYSLQVKALEAHDFLSTIGVRTV